MMTYDGFLVERAFGAFARPWTFAENSDPRCVSSYCHHEQDPEAEDASWLRETTLCL